MTWWLLTDPADLEPDQQAIVTHLCAAEPVVRMAASLVRRFGGLVRERCLADLAPWLTEAEHSAIPEMRGSRRAWALLVIDGAAIHSPAQAWARFVAVAEPREAAWERP